MSTLKEAIRDQALALGFHAVGFAAPEVTRSAKDRLAEFLSSGSHGDMGWMAAKADRRADPKVLWPEAKAVS